MKAGEGVGAHKGAELKSAEGVEAKKGYELKAAEGVEANQGYELKSAEGVEAHKGSKLKSAEGVEAHKGYEFGHVIPDAFMNRRQKRKKKKTLEYEVKWQFKPIEANCWVEKDILIKMGYIKLVRREDER